MFQQLFGSKKFLASLAGVIFVAVQELGWNLSEQTVMMVLGLVASYVVGQGIADAGKEAAKVKK